MKIRFLLVSIFFALNQFSLQAEDRYPRYREVVNYFFDNYSLQNKKEEEDFRFEKTPEGWILSIRDPYKDKTSQEFVLWDKKQAAFQKADLVPLKEGEDNSKERVAFMSALAPHFDACPYFNYRGWDWDVIRDFTEFDKLDDTTLYGVGRAYSSVAAGFLNDNSGISNTAKSFSPSPGFNSLYPEQLETYRMYHKKAIMIYEMVFKRNPDFETLVGPIGTKLNHEYMTAYLDLLQYQNEEEALKEVPDQLYNDFQIEIAENYLASMQPNAIIFVHGDGDTYPLLYVQAKRNFRKDVTVINVSLLLTAPYIEMLRKGNAFAPALKISLTEQEFSNGKYDVVVINQGDQKFQDADKLISFAKDPNTMLESGGTGYHTLPGTQWYLKRGRNAIHFILPYENYIIGSMLVELDLIINHLAGRPIYFGQGMAEEYFMGMSHHLSLEGLVYRLNFKKNKDGLPGWETIQEEPLQTNLLKDYKFDGLKFARKGDKLLIENYSYLFYMLAAHYVDEKQKVKAIEVLDKHFSLIPNSLLPYDNTFAHFAELYYKAGAIDKGNAIGKQVLYNLKNKLIHQGGLFEENTFEENKPKIIETLKGLSVLYKQENFYKELW